MQKREAITLTSAIIQSVEPGSTLYSDYCKAYNLLQSSDYKHSIEQHRKSFAVDYQDPITAESERVHTIVLRMHGNMRTCAA